MYVSHLSLTDFRSYATVDLELGPGVNAFLGRNGQGKTNLVEAIGYLATLRSHRVPTDAALVRAGAPRAVVRARVVRGDRASTVDLEIVPGKANRARINRAPAGRARDVLGMVRTVLFAPEDLALVKGDPEGRRRFLDDLTVLLAPRMAGVLADYDRIVRQRSALLKSLGGVRGRGRRSRPAPPPPADGEGDTAASGTDPQAAALATLAVWDERLAAAGAQVVAFRARLVHALGPDVETAYAQVSGSDSRANITYRPALGPDDVAPARDVQVTTTDPASAAAGDETSAEPRAWVAPSVADLEKRLLAAMDRLRAQELDRGVSLVGPHRDDVELRLGDLPAKGYASHGESWSFALALRLASYRLLTVGPSTLGAAGAEAVWDDPLAVSWAEDSEPVLILDDVFAELDAQRREQLAALVADARQVLITAAVAQDVPESLAGARFTVAGGEVTRADEQ